MVLIMTILLFVQSSFGLSDRQERRLNKLIEKVYQTDSDQVTWKALDLASRKYDGDVLIELSYQSEIMGYLAGRKIADQYLNYFPVFAFDAKGILLQAYILEMNTIKGSEISSRMWLRQFSGYQGEALEYGRQIDALSGATLSGLSMVREVQYYFSLIRQVTIQSGD